MTLNGCIALCSTASFEGHNGNMNEVLDSYYQQQKCIRETTFRWYKTRVDIHGGSEVRGAQTTVGWSELAFFGNSGHHMFEAVKN